MKECLSHNDRKLKNHLTGTLKWGKHLVSETNIALLNTFDKRLIENMLYFHDIGKAMQYFQDYLHDKPVNTRLKAHSLISAVLFLYINLIKKEPENKMHLLLCAIAIVSHHATYLYSIKTEIDKLRSIKRNEYIEKQWESIDKSQLSIALCDSNVDEVLINKLASSDIKDIISIVSDYAKSMARELRHLKLYNCNNSELSLEKYFKMQYLFSLLTDCDKSDVVIRDYEFVKRIQYSLDVDKFLSIIGKNAKNNFLNELRGKAYCEAQDSASKVDFDKDRIMHLTLPTGMGKTLTSINFAIKLKRRLDKEYGKKYRIIYALPFLSIIDQNAKIIEKIIDINNDDIDIKNKVLIKHHHLEPYGKILNNDEDENYNFNEIYIEGWNAEIIITSFVQLFETIIGYTNRKQRKYNKLSNCIIIADEIQSIPVKYYLLINKVICEYVGLYNSYFIAMTATQPRIFEGERTFGLVNPVIYYKKLNRIELINKSHIPQTIPDFIDSLEPDNKRTLFIMNTIGSAIELFEGLKRAFPEKNVGFLSTEVVPSERLSRIDKIKKKEYDLVVSTQLIEAGVDVDFERVYRDICPVPSIIQSAGRANREWGDVGCVIIICLINVNSQTYASMIYRNSSVDLSTTMEILEPEKIYNEPELNNLTERYYTELCINKVKSMDESKLILKGMNECIFSETERSDILPVSSFKLIDDKILKYPVYVEIDENAIQLWSEYEELLVNNSLDKWVKKSKLKNIQKKMAQYTITVSENKIRKYNIPQERNNYYYIQNSMLTLYYDFETGYGSSEMLSL
jgi:CRISPR-associated endonuclease/helicase Cas3